MMPQVTAAALVSENKVLAHPASVDSITTSGNKEDYVSMGMTAAIKLKRIVENTRNVLAIEAMAVAQAIDFLAPLKTSKRGQAAHAAIRSVCPTVDKDRVMYKDFARIAELIASGKVAEVVAVVCPSYRSAFRFQEAFFSRRHLLRLHADESIVQRGQRIEFGRFCQDTPSLSRHRPWPYTPGSGDTGCAGLAGWTVAAPQWRSHSLSRPKRNPAGKFVGLLHLCAILCGLRALANSSA